MGSNLVYTPVLWGIFGHVKCLDQSERKYLVDYNDSQFSGFSESCERLVLSYNPCIFFNFAQIANAIACGRTIIGGHLLRPKMIEYFINKPFLRELISNKANQGHHTYIHTYRLFKHDVKHMLEGSCI